MLFTTMSVRPYATVRTSARRRYRQDVFLEADTLVVFCYREGAGVGQHPNGNRGASTVNFATGAAEPKCEDKRRFASLHGALMLVAWMFVAPAGIYYIRCANGKVPFCLTTPSHLVPWSLSLSPSALFR